MPMATGSGLNRRGARSARRARRFPGILKGMVMPLANWFYPEEPAKGYHGLFISNPNVLTTTTITWTLCTARRT